MFLHIFLYIVLLQVSFWSFSCPVSIRCPFEGNPIYWWHSEYISDPLPSAHLYFLGDSVCSYSNVQLDFEIVFLQNMLISNTVRVFVHVRLSACMNRADCGPLCSSIACCNINPIRKRQGIKSLWHVHARERQLFCRNVD